MFAPVKEWPFHNSCSDYRDQGRKDGKLGSDEGIRSGPIEFPVRGRLQFMDEFPSGCKRPYDSFAAAQALVAVIFYAP